jgi:hypothetical protein
VARGPDPQALADAIAADPTVQRIEQDWKEREDKRLGEAHAGIAPEVEVQKTLRLISEKARAEAATAVAKHRKARNAYERQARKVAVLRSRIRRQAMPANLNLKLQQAKAKVRDKLRSKWLKQQRITFDKLTRTP